MSDEENKALVRRFFEQVVTGRQIEAVAEYFVPNSFLARAMKNGVNTFFTGFPDLKFTADDVLADSDKVIVRFTLSGTNTGPFMEHPPTGNSMTATGIHIYRIQAGKIVTSWQEFDMLSTMRQLGLIPIPGQ